MEKERTNDEEVKLLKEKQKTYTVKMEICLLSEHLDVANQDVLQYQS
jgi:hypothetical protein